jgi:hypothetical protein
MCGYTYNLNVVCMNLFIIIHLFILDSLTVSCELRDEPSYSIKSGEFFLLAKLLKMTLLHVAHSG